MREAKKRKQKEMSSSADKKLRKFNESNNTSTSNTGVPSSNVPSNNNTSQTVAENKAHQSNVAGVAGASNKGEHTASNTQAHHTTSPTIIENNVVKGSELICSMIAAAVTASKEAGQIIREVKFSGEMEIKEKGEKTDYVTKADLEAQRCIVRHLRTLYPKVQYRGEEGKLDENYEAKTQPKKDENVMDITSKHLKELKDNRPDFNDITEDNLFVWIDPLDGTREYVMNDESVNREVTILIGIAYKGRPIAGVINQPFFHKISETNYDEGIVWAICGLGVYHNRNSQDNKNYSRYEIPEANNSGKHRIVTSRAHATDIIKKSLEAIPGSEIVYRGGAGYKTIVLLDDEADCYLYPSRGLKRWDTCAPEAVVRALYGECTDIFNNRYDYSNIDENSYENLLGLVAAFSNHNFYIQNIKSEMINHVWTEAAKPKREKKKH